MLFALRTDTVLNIWHVLVLDVPVRTCYWVMVQVSQNCYLVQSGTCFTNSPLCLTACWPELSASRAPPSEEIVNALFQRLVVCGALVRRKLLNVHALMCHPGYMLLSSPLLPSPPLSSPPLLGQTESTSRPGGWPSLEEQRPEVAAHFGPGTELAEVPHACSVSGWGEGYGCQGI